MEKCNFQSVRTSIISGQSIGVKVEEWKGGKINHKRDTNRLVILYVLSDLVVKRV